MIPDVRQGKMVKKKKLKKERRANAKGDWPYKRAIIISQKQNKIENTAHYNFMKVEKRNEVKMF